jgi:hypothetical protein
MANLMLDAIRGNGVCRFRWQDLPLEALLFQLAVFVRTHKYYSVVRMMILN